MSDFDMDDFDDEVDDDYEEHGDDLYVGGDEFDDLSGEEYLEDGEVSEDISLGETDSEEDHEDIALAQPYEPVFSNLIRQEPFRCSFVSVDQEL